MRLETEFFLQNSVSFSHNSVGSSEWITSAIEIPTHQPLKAPAARQVYSNTFETGSDENQTDLPII